MTICVTVSAGYVVQDDSGTCESVLISSSEYQQLTENSSADLIELLNGVFEFDPVLFQDYLVFCLVTFIAAFAAGIVVRQLTR